MKYIWLNIKKFMRAETTLFSLFVLCIVATMITVLFFFGLFQNLKQEELDGTYGEKRIQLDMQGDFDTEVTLGKVKDYCMGLGADIHEKCYFLVCGRLAEDKEEDIYPECHLGMEFSISKGVFTLSPFAQDAWKDSMVDGAYFSAEQIEQGEMVCVALPDEVRERNSDARYWAEKYVPDENDEYLIDGKKYKCIGHAEYGGWMPKVPITTVSDDCPVKYIMLYFENVITKSEYQRITEDALAYFGDYVSVPPLQIADQDTKQYYRTALLECLFMMGMAGVVLTVLFRYILMLRKKQLTIFRLCGLTVKMAKMQYIVECVLITLIGSVLGFVIYRYGLLEYLSSIYIYIQDYYAWYTYVLLMGLYIVVVSVMQYWMIKKTTEDEIVTVLRGNQK